jgi:zinc D-Ala-D-Ala dipeptidase
MSILPAPADEAVSAAPVFPRHEDPALPGLVDVGARLPEAVVDLRYRGTDNFMNRDVYGGLRRCFLVPMAADMLVRAHEGLKARAPGLTFVLWDGARPRRVQEIMWDLVKGTQSESYVANPHAGAGSLHSYGCAVDLSLYDSEARAPLDMGTPYDFFGRLAEPRHELALYEEGVLSGAQLANRLLLREVMLRAGFLLLANEWWHFHSMPGHEAQSRYAVIA